MSKGWRDDGLFNIHAGDRRVKTSLLFTSGTTSSERRLEDDLDVLYELLAAHDSFDRIAFRVSNLIAPLSPTISGGHFKNEHLMTCDVLLKEADPV